MTQVGGNWLPCLLNKANRYGKNILKVNRLFARSQIDLHCHHKLDSLPLSVRHWVCPSCHTEHDSDVNASINIRNQALADVAGFAIV